MVYKKKRIIFHVDKNTFLAYKDFDSILRPKRALLTKTKQGG